MNISFSFTKTSKRKLETTASSKLDSSADKKLRTDDAVEYIQSIGVNGAATTISSKESNELVIPLIKQNRWYFPKASADTRNHGTAATNGSTDKGQMSNGVNDDDLEQQAIRELLSDVRENTVESVLNIPLLVQNRIPDGFETDDNLDVSLRPAEPTLDDYDRIPIEEFGLAMLRGMGWKKGEGVGLRNKRVVEMKEPEMRPRGLGLGATRPNTDLPDDKKNGKVKRSSSPPTMGLRLSQKKNDKK